MCDSRDARPPAATYLDLEEGPAFTKVAITLLAITAIALGVLASHLASERDAARGAREV
jgi:hypothetical protein